MYNLSLSEQEFYLVKQSVKFVSDFYSKEAKRTNGVYTDEVKADFYTVIDALSKLSYKLASVERKEG